MPHGRKMALQPDMLLRADIILETRTLVDWLLNATAARADARMIQTCSWMSAAGRRLPKILQTEAAECGLACLAMIASYHGHRIDLNTLRRRHPVSLQGVTLRGLIQMANQMHLACRPLRFELDDLRRLTLPAIVHWDMNHFVVLKAITSKGIVVHDPASGSKTYSFAEASKHLTGVALELSPAEGFTPKNEKARLPFRAFWGQMTGVAYAAGPDLRPVGDPGTVRHRRAVLHADSLSTRSCRAATSGLMLASALGFGLLTAINVATTALRSHIVFDCAERACTSTWARGCSTTWSACRWASSRSATSAMSCRASSPSSRSAMCLPKD